MLINTGIDLKTSFFNSSFRFMIFTKALMKELPCIFIDVHKSSTVGCPSKLSCHVPPNC